MTATFHFNVWLFMMLRLPFLIGRGVNQNVLVLRGTSTSQILPPQSAAKDQWKDSAVFEKRVPGSRYTHPHVAPCSNEPDPTNTTIDLAMAEVSEIG